MRRSDLFADFKEYNKCTITNLNTIVDLDTYSDGFIKTFNSMYWFNNINFVDEDEFWAYITRVFEANKDTFLKKITKYEELLDESKGYYRDETITENGESSATGSSDGSNSHIDLPNRTTQNNYVSDKNNVESSFDNSGDYSKTITTQRKGGVNIIDQRERVIKYYRNMFIEMCETFKDAFLKIYL